MLTALHSVTHREEYEEHEKYFLPLWKYTDISFVTESNLTIDELATSEKANGPLCFVFSGAYSSTKSFKQGKHEKHFCNHCS